MSVHTIFVPWDLSVEQAWEHIQRGARIKEGSSAEGRWVRVDDRGSMIPDQRRYACHWIGHAIGADGVCACCLKVIR